MEKTNDVLKLAKQGNPKAIEAVFNKQLSASNIAVKAIVRDGCLQIMFESKQALSQVTMVNGVKKVLTAIKPENIQTVKVYSKQTGDDFPKWDEEFELAEKKKVDVSPNIDLTQLEVPKPSETIPASDSNESPLQAKNRATESPQLIDTNAKSHVNDLTNNLTSPNIADEDSLLMERARWGYLDSISTLLNSSFNGHGVSVTLNKTTAKFLEIILKSNDIIDKQIAIEIICRILNKTKTRVFNEISVSVDTSESNFPSWNQNLTFKDNQFTEKEDVVVNSPDSDVFSHLAKFVIEAKDNINKLDTQIGNKLNLSSTTNLNVNQDGQLIANISNALKQYNQALSIAKAEVVDNVCLDLEIESKEEIKRLNLLFVTATIRKELDKLDEETIELVNLTMRELKGVNGVNTETIWTKKIYKTPDVNQSTNSSLNQGNKHEFLKVNTTGDTNTLKTAGAVVIAGIVLFGLFQLYRFVEYETKYSDLKEGTDKICGDYRRLLKSSIDRNQEDIRRNQENIGNYVLRPTDDNEQREIKKLQEECESRLDEQSRLSRKYKGY
jgi:hypothetical protein